MNSLNITAITIPRFLKCERTMRWTHRCRFYWSESAPYCQKQIICGHWSCAGKWNSLLSSDGLMRTNDSTLLLVHTRTTVEKGTSTIKIVESVGRHCYELICKYCSSTTCLIWICRGVKPRITAPANDFLLKVLRVALSTFARLIRTTGETARAEIRVEQFSR